MKQKGRGDAVSSTSCGLSRSGCLLQRGGEGRQPPFRQPRSLCCYMDVLRISAAVGHGGERTRREWRCMAAAAAA